ncbi:nucleophile aminohydrolase [Scleroderma yunnanense]
MGSEKFGAAPSARNSAFYRWKQRVSRSDNNFVLVIHGGAGVMITRETATPEKRAAYRGALDQALKAGYEVLKDGGEAMDAAVAAVSVLEDCPLFNAGKGSVFNIVGKNELEASIMLSKPPSTHSAILATRRGTSLALLTSTRNPSQLVRGIYLAADLVPHPMISGATAESIGSEELGIPTVDPSYFWTEARWREHRRGLGLPEEPIQNPSRSNAPSDGGTLVGSVQWEEKLDSLDLMPTGTVGAVALDIRGCIATVTSTGGRTNKLVGRIGDTPIMGSGFWAEEWNQKRGFLGKTWDLLRGESSVQGIGVSGTGDGDYFIRQNTASTIAHRMQFLREPVVKAAEKVVTDMKKAGGLGGVIALDKKGNVALSLNCSGMYRGIIRSDGIPLTAIFFDEELSQL